MLAGTGSFYPGLETSADMTIYVSYNSGSDSNNGLSSSTPVKTLARAVSLIPRVVNHAVIISCAAATFPETLYVAGFVGKGSITVSGDTTYSCYITAVSLVGNQIPVYVDHFMVNSTGVPGFYAAYNMYTVFTSCSVITTDTSNFGFHIQGGRARIDTCTSSNRNVGVRVNNSGHCYCSSVSGTGNTYGTWVSEGSTCSVNASSITGTTVDYLTSGGLTTRDGFTQGQNGIMNPPKMKDAYLELGYYRSDSSGPAYIDFHTNNLSYDYDARIVANDYAPSAATGAYLQYEANHHRFLNKVWLNPQTAYGSAPNVTVAIGDSDTGFNWNGDGVLEMYSNAAVAAKTTSDGWFNIKGPDGSFYNTGVLWGTHSRAYRSYASAWKATQQSISAATWTKLLYTEESADAKGEYTASTAIFVPAETSTYLVAARVGLTSVSAGGTYILRVYIGSSSYQIACASPAAAVSSFVLAGAGTFVVSAGQSVYIELYASTAVTTVIGTATTAFDIIRIA